MLAPAQVEALRRELAEAQAKVAEFRDTMLRERAELENQRRRQQRDMEQARRYANEKLLNDLLPIYDGLERGLAIETADVAGVREGIGLTLKELLRIAGNNGLVQLDPLGEPLDPQLHHAVSVVDAPGSKPDTVVTVLQKGYVLNERLLRPALVVVAKGA
ncbi:MAG: nucleotide exchange factor GrpE [Rhodanobacter sp.]